MDPVAFLAAHQCGLGKLLGITFPAAARHRVVAQLDIEPEHLAPDGAVNGGIVVALADCASTYGAVLNLPRGGATMTIELKTNFLAAGQGGTLRAEASPIHSGNRVAVWRAAVFRGDQSVADVTQTQMTVEDDDRRCGPRQPKRQRPGRGRKQFLQDGG